MEAYLRLFPALYAIENGLEKYSDEELQKLISILEKNDETVIR